MRRYMRKPILGGVCLLCLASTGCLQVPFIVPEMSVVSATRPGCEPSEVHAFRVDVTQRSELKEGGPPDCKVTGENVETLQLAAIPLADDGTTTAQVAVNCATGWSYFGFWNYLKNCTSHSVAVRLYRAGYETIELKPGQDPRQMQWREAVGLAAQEKAVDALLGVSPLEMNKALGETLQRRLEPGTRSTAHRDALLFAAREYERLARTISADELRGDETRAALIDKSRRVKLLADGKSPNGTR